MVIELGCDVCDKKIEGLTKRHARSLMYQHKIKHMNEEDEEYDEDEAYEEE